MALRFTDDIFYAKRLKALEGVLTASTCDVRDVRLPAACTPEIAAAAARGAWRGSRSRPSRSEAVRSVPRDAYSIAQRRRADQAFGPDARRRVGEEVDRRERVDSDRECGTPSSVRRRHLRFRRGPTSARFSADGTRPRSPPSAPRTAIRSPGSSTASPARSTPGRRRSTSPTRRSAFRARSLSVALFESRRDHDSLRTLRLDRSTLGTEGGVVLAEALASKACANLQHLHVAGASLGAAGVEAVCGSVPASLASLDLAANAGGDRGAVAAGRRFGRCPLLVRLSVAANEIGAEGARASRRNSRSLVSGDSDREWKPRRGSRGDRAGGCDQEAAKAPFKDLFLDDNVNLSGPRRDRSRVSRRCPARPAVGYFARDDRRGGRGCTLLGSRRDDVPQTVGTLLV